MGIVKLPDRRMYWAKSTCVPAISETTSRNRFEDVLRVLHFNDNALQKERGEPGYNRIYKLQPPIDKFRKNFKEKVLPETYHAIDEMMVAFKGRHGLKQYMQKKPTKWGYKLWCRSGISGYTYDFEVCGSETKGLPDGVNLVRPVGEYGNVVIRLTHELQPNKHSVF